jgi:hypothetical protein
MERGKMIQKHLSKAEWGIFVDAPDIGNRK